MRATSAASELLQVNHIQHQHQHPLSTHNKVFNIRLYQFVPDLTSTSEFPHGDTNPEDDQPTVKIQHLRLLSSIRPSTCTHPSIVIHLQRIIHPFFHPSTQPPARPLLSFFAHHPTSNPQSQEPPSHRTTSALPVLKSSRATSSDNVNARLHP